jgi:heme/copper-type cytochrome/quinol oxidase subunit 1
MATTAPERLTRLWEAPAGLSFRLATVDHKQIGIRYLATAFVFFILAGGARVCLYTDQANPTSNRIYAALGYRPVVDMANLTLLR